MLGFQAIIRRTKRGRVTHVEYHGPTGTALRFIYSKRFDSWEWFDSTGRQGFVSGSWVAAVLRKCEERILAMQPRVEEVYGPWKESYGS